MNATTYASVLILTLASAAAVQAQHSDVLLAVLDGQIATGFAENVGSGSTTHALGKRVFTRTLGSGLFANDPGFFALPSGSPSLPSGAEALPGSFNLYWDLMPMTLAGSSPRFSSGLLYWDGVGEVDFGAPPEDDYSLALFNPIAESIAATVSPQVAVGPRLLTTRSNGSTDTHNYFVLDDDTDPDDASQAADGVYLAAMRLRAEGLRASEPFYLLFGTLSVSLATLNDTAAPWVEERVDSLILAGDYNRDGVVDAADFTVWRDHLGASDDLMVDGDGDLVVDEDDYQIWVDHFGEAADFGQSASLSVPEPNLLGGVLITVVVGGLSRRARLA
ncbi:hypothetical protein Mal64_33270 [Pseudobythopirellula maris]|uniref:Dockerin domain-containing protein n=1 Tax=Pseudobythopirellula maris TaxID=2527991 RepID=A0A5C5ZI66_9BACT|nr:hypothetical protein [Pseudobythopirellula maris]TWT86501.1 hypothetical protein Mal64_33270 [Pseudobythopirellula maris]